LTVGGSADFFEDGIKDRNQFNPKFGVTWNPFSATTLRAAVFRTLKRTLVADQTVEPTQVAGFNQFFDDFNSTESWRYGIAADQKFSKDIYGGIEYSRRNLNVPTEVNSASPAASVTVVQRLNWEERLGRAYLYWAPHPWLGLSGEYQYERFDREASPSVSGERTLQRIAFPWESVFTIRLD